MGQIACMLSNWPWGGLPSNSETNPREHEKAITLYSGREVEMRLESERENGKEVEQEEIQGKTKSKVIDVTPVWEHQPRIPYLAWLKKAEFDD